MRKARIAVDLGMEATSRWMKMKTLKMLIKTMKSLLMTQSLSHLRWMSHTVPQVASGSATWTTAGGRSQSRYGHTVSQRARSTGDFATLWALERQAMFVAAHRTAFAKMFISLGIANDIVDANVDKQGYNTAHALSCFDNKGIEMLVTVTCKPHGIKS